MKNLLNTLPKGLQFELNIYLYVEFTDGTYTVSKLGFPDATQAETASLVEIAKKGAQTIAEMFEKEMLDYRCIGSELYEQINATMEDCDKHNLAINEDGTQIATKNGEEVYRAEA